MRNNKLLCQINMFPGSQGCFNQITNSNNVVWLVLLFQLLFYIYEKRITELKTIFFFYIKINLHCETAEPLKINPYACERFSNQEEFHAITLCWVHIIYGIVLFLFYSGCQSAQSSIHQWWVSQCTTTTSCCSTRWTSPSPCSSAWWPPRSAPNPSASSGTTLYCKYENAEEGADNWKKFSHRPVVFVFYISAGNGGWSAKGCEVVFRNSTHISCQCYHMTSFAVLMDISRREVSDNKPSYLHQNRLTFLYRSNSFLLTVTFASEWRDPANQDPDVEYCRCDTGLPLPHHDLPPLSESHAVQQDEYNEQRSDCSLPLWASLHPGHQPCRQPGDHSVLFFSRNTTAISSSSVI